MGNKVLFVHGGMDALGGAELYAIRAIHILQKLGYSVDFVHAGSAPSLERLHDWSGIDLNGEALRFISIHSLSPALSLIGKISGLMAYAACLRAARRLYNTGSYDVVASTYGELPYVKRAEGKIYQIIHFPLFFYDREALRALGVDESARLKYYLRSALVVASRAVAGWNRAVVEAVPALCNSNWTSNQFIDRYRGAKAVEFAYPGASVNYSVSADAAKRFEIWSQRSKKMCIVGRVVPQKRVELAVDVVSRLRSIGLDFELTILGGASDRYGSKIGEVIRDKPWIRWVRGLNRAGMEAEIQTCRYGIHCSEVEHYGIVPVELIQLGCVPFVFNNAGPAEVVRLSDLCYDSVPDAVSKISNFENKTDAEISEILSSLFAVGQRHSVARFNKDLSAFLSKGALESV